MSLVRAVSRAIDKSAADAWCLPPFNARRGDEAPSKAQYHAAPLGIFRHPLASFCIHLHPFVSICIRKSLFAKHLYGFPLLNPRQLFV